MAESQNNPNPGGSPGIDEIDATIKAERETNSKLQPSTRAWEKSNERLDELYRVKAGLLKSKPKSERDDGAVNFEPAIDDVGPDGKVMTEEQRQARDQLDEMRGEINNAYGPTAVDQVGDLLIGEHGPFRDAAALDGFVSRSGLDLEGQREAMHALGELASMPLPATKISVDSTIQQVTEDLKNLWGGKFDANITLARETVDLIWGSAQKFDTYAARRGWTKSPQHQLKAVLALVKLGRRIAKARSSE